MFNRKDKAKFLNLQRFDFKLWTACLFQFSSSRPSVCSAAVQDINALIDGSYKSPTVVSNKQIKTCQPASKKFSFRLEMFCVGLDIIFPPFKIYFTLRRLRAIFMLLLFSHFYPSLEYMSLMVSG